VRLPLFRHFERTHTVLGRSDVVAFALEVQRDHLAGLRIVFDKEDAAAHAFIVAGDVKIG
jgi:hypothetical protein